MVWVSVFSHHLRTECVASRDVHHAELLDDEFALGALTRRRRTCDDDPRV
jgi:hypothetical protein